ncbi:class I SAM-dependent methyltransferase [Magnetospira sp. QH-2]|uniref:class I SAM-dependent methyltransferase n=1 Tax=Magnetospira sp. (strain QH-2) TaxID=1288970 RepID=UPI0003E8141A|nr:class I SAM-dependent methyltransferase [Magnetospira sp. QH-2]CCQ75270.1 conserved protein of unknown function [Magnetospira sp. QH-2]
MYLCFLMREGLVSFLPRGGTVAEIGVAQGEFSKVILDGTEPKHLHLIDPWIHQDDPSYAADPNNAPMSDQNANFRSVSEQFAEQSASGQVIIHRTYSQAAVNRFEDRQFDWIYVDGLHTREGVTRDLALYWDKVKDDGFIVGHDYTNIEPARKMGFGVIEAVDSFVAERGAEFIALTAEAYPTYLLAKQPGQHCEQMKASLLYHVPDLVEIREPLNRFQLSLVTVGDKMVLLRSF